MASRETLRRIAYEILEDYLDKDIEFSIVYEDDLAVDLSNEDQRAILDLMSAASIEFTIPEDDELDLA